jgi:hypothetical protein
MSNQQVTTWRERETERGREGGEKGVKVEGGGGDRREGGGEMDINESKKNFFMS